MLSDIFQRSVYQLKSGVRSTWRRLINEPYWPDKATLALEVSGVCNLRCPMCSYPNTKRQKGFMEWDLFEKIVDDVIENGHNIASLHFFGEPLLWPHIVEGVALLAKNNIFPRISTNGMLLTGTLARQLQNAGMKEIMVTIDTLMPEVYPKIRCGGNFSLVKQNIHDALNAAPNVLLSAQMMPTKYNQNETVEDFYREFGRRSNFKVEPWFVARMNGAENISQRSYHRPDEVDKRLCNKIFERVDVLWDGTTVLCCLDAEGQLVTGNLNENSIAYSWQGPKAMALRKMIMSGEWMKLNPCRQCAADHIVWTNGRWHLTNPPAKLPQEQRWILEYIQRLDSFDEEQGQWTKN